MAGIPVTGDVVSYTENGRLFSNSELSVFQSFVQAKKDADKKRRQAMEKRVDVYRDDYQQILRNRISSQFAKENAEELVKVLDLTNNPLKRIVDDLSNVYVRPAKWSFDTGSKDTDKALAEQWNAILDGNTNRLRFPQINAYTNLCNDVWVQVAPAKVGLKLFVVTPDNLIAWQDPEDPTQPIAIAYRLSFAQTPTATPRWHFWSRDPKRAVHEVIEGEDFDSKTARIVSREANPYTNDEGEPVLPGCFYHRALPVDALFDETSGDDIYELTLNVGCWETWINHLVRTDSLALKYVTGQLDPRGMPTMSSLSIMQLVPSGADGHVNAGQFHSQSDWKGLGDQFTRKLQNVLANNGLSMADFQLSGDPTSGFALRVRKEGLVERREKQIALYAEYDRHLYDAFAAVWNFERTNRLSKVDGPEMPCVEDANPTIKYADFQTTLSVQERGEELTLIQEKLSMALLSVVDVVKMDHPDLTDEEAEQLLADNKALNEKYLPKTEVVAGRASVLQGNDSAAAGAAPGTPGNGGQANGQPGNGGGAAPAPVDHKAALAQMMVAKVQAQKAKAEKP